MQQREPKQCVWSFRRTKLQSQHTFSTEKQKFLPWLRAREGVRKHFCRILEDPRAVHSFALKLRCAKVKLSCRPGCLQAGGGPTLLSSTSNPPRRKGNLQHSFSAFTQGNYVHRRVIAPGLTGCVRMTNVTQDFQAIPPDHPTSSQQKPKLYLRRTSGHCVQAGACHFWDNCSESLR